MSLESPKKQQCLNQRQQSIMSSTARMAALYSAWFDVIKGSVVATSFEILSVLKKRAAPEPPWEGEVPPQGPLVGKFKLFNLKKILEKNLTKIQEYFFL